MAYPKNGFKPVSNLVASNPRLMQFAVSAGTTHAFFIGDLVQLKSTGKVIPIAASTSAQTLAVGVVQSVFKDNGAGNPPKPLTFNQPTTGNFLSTAQAGYVKVNIDSNQVYMVHYPASASVGLIGSTARVSAGSPNTLVGRSGQSLNTTLGTGADGVVKIVGIEDTLDGTTDKPSGTGVLVKLNGTFFTATAGI